jgi:butyrate kinase
VGALVESILKEDLNEDYLKGYNLSPDEFEARKEAIVDSVHERFEAIKNFLPPASAVGGAAGGVLS